MTKSCSSLRSLVRQYRFLGIYIIREPLRFISIGDLMCRSTISLPFTTVQQTLILNYVLKTFRNSDGVC